MLRLVPEYVDENMLKYINNINIKIIIGFSIIFKAKYV